MTFAQIEEAGVKERLSGIRQELLEKRHKPQPVRRAMIPKPGGGERAPGIPAIRDRAVQTAVKLVIEPVLEADLSAYTFGYRPKRSALDAIKAVQSMLGQGYTVRSSSAPLNVVDADLSKYFDAIPHSELLESVAARISGRNILRIPKMRPKLPRLSSTLPKACATKCGRQIRGKSATAKEISAPPIRPNAPNAASARLNLSAAAFDKG